MNWDQIKGNWNQVKGKARHQFADLTDDDLEKIAGDRDQMIGALQKRRGLSREEAERELDNWSQNM